MSFSLRFERFILSDVELEAILENYITMSITQTLE
jgi:hypothetical protein